ncbi:MAG: hypothetical protein ACR2N3_12530 [Pyrinomonadaceae bacterium]
MQKQDEEKIPNANRENWNAQELAKQSANEESDETLRKVLRGNEGLENPDSRDVVGAVDSDETPQGREENKNQTGVKKND